MTKHFRTDLATLTKDPVITPAGYLQADAYITRAGVLEYTDNLGRVTRELRHPDDVFDPESMLTARLVPVTDLHPQFPVHSGTAKFVQSGSTGDDVRRDGEMMGAMVGITDFGLIERVQQGQRELSMGYVCELVAEAGVWMDAQGVSHPYDARQKNIRYDHCAVVPKGRAGDEVRLRIDGKHSRIDAASVRKDAGNGTHQRDTMKIKIDGIETEVPDVAGQLIEAALAKRDGAVTAAQTEAKQAKEEADKQKGRADAAEAKAATEEKARKDAAAPGKVRELIKARMDLEKTAAKLGVEKADELDDGALKKACIVKIQPETKLDGKSDAYVDGIFEFVAQAAAKKDGLDPLREVLTPAGGAPKNDADEAAKNMIEANKNAVAEYRKARGG